MKQCPKCYDAFADDATYCHQDGTKLVELLHCPRCGRPYFSHHKFCESCGFALRKVDNSHDSKV